MSDLDGWGHDGPATDSQFSYVARTKQPAKKRSGKTPEAKVTAACDAYLKSIGALVIRTNSGSWSDEQGNIIMGAKGGTSDKTLCLPGGHFAALELKAGTNTLSAAQQAYKARVERLGGVFIEAHSAAELRAGLVQAFGADRVASWEAAAACAVDAKAQRRAALMKKMGQIK